VTSPDVSRENIARLRHLLDSLDNLEGPVMAGEVSAEIGIFPINWETVEFAHRLHLVGNLLETAQIMLKDLLNQTTTT
jgi:hypothetical protein